MCVRWSRWWLYFGIQKAATMRVGVVDLRVVPELKMAAVAGER
jgi:hypothetical protein